MIEGYRFGEIIISGQTYNRDLIIYVQGQELTIFPNWWRKEGHLLQVEDLNLLWGKNPKVLVIGTGASGIMKIHPKVIEKAENLGIEVKASLTSEAVKIFNQLFGKVPSLAGAFHLTC